MHSLGLTAGDGGDAEKAAVICRKPLKGQFGRLQVALQESGLARREPNPSLRKTISSCW